MSLHLTRRIFLTVSVLMLGLLLVTSWLGINHFQRKFEQMTAEHLAVLIGAAAQDADLHLRQADEVRAAVAYLMENSR